MKCVLLLFTCLLGLVLSDPVPEASCEQRCEHEKDVGPNGRTSSYAIRVCWLEFQEEKAQLKDGNAHFLDPNYHGPRCQQALRECETLCQKLKCRLVAGVQGQFLDGKVTVECREVAWICVALALVVVTVQAGRLPSCKENCQNDDNILANCVDEFVQRKRDKLASAFDTPRAGPECLKSVNLCTDSCRLTMAGIRND